MTDVSASMQFEGARILDDATLGEDRWELAERIYKAMDRAKPFIPEPHDDGRAEEATDNSALWPAASGPVNVFSMETGHIRHCLIRLATELGDEMGTSRKDGFRLRWIGIFQRTLVRRRAALN